MSKLVQIGQFIFWMAGATLLTGMAMICFQVYIQLHRTPTLSLKAEAAVDYVGRAAQNFDQATAVWKTASQSEADYMQKTLPVLTKQAETNLNNSNALLVSLRQSSDKAGLAIDGLSAQSQAVLAAAKDTITTTNKLVADTNSSLQPVLTDSSQTVHDLDAFIQSPEIKGTLVNIQQTSGNVADATKESAQILKDGRIVADKYVAPQKWYIKVIAYVLKSGELVYDFVR